MKDCDNQAARDPNSVCFITQTGAVGGVAIHTMRLMEALLSRGYRIELIQCRYHGFDSWHEGLASTARKAVSILHVGFHVNAPPGAWRPVMGALNSATLIFPKGGNFMGGIGLLRLWRRTFSHLYFIEHLEAPPVPERSSARYFGVIPGLGLWWYKRWLTHKVRAWYANRLVDRIIAVSEKVKGRLLEDWQYTPGKIVVVRNGVYWQHFIRDEERGHACRVRCDIPSDGFVFGMVTRLSEEKGIDIALRALRYAMDSVLGRRPYLLIAGGGPQANELQALSAALGVDENVRFIGFISDVRDVLFASDVILFSSRLEGLPLGLLEGMAAGCVPVVTQVSGMPEVVDSSEIGFVVSPESPVELGEAMKNVMTLDRDAFERLRNNAVQRVRENFDAAKSYVAILDVCGLRGEQKASVESLNICTQQSDRS
ncbi:MAG: glycosyltransferase family 4 protein [Chromatiales bacterium]|jgi:glycosyltransferase involved in cell wall biosynthesis|nr:glycosyltransferase family 4 protein [Chromatiales bacterium]